MSKSSKTEALKKHLGNVICTKCDSKKHSTKNHGSMTKSLHKESGEQKAEKETESDESKG